MICVAAEERSERADESMPIVYVQNVKLQSKSNELAEIVLHHAQVIRLIAYKWLMRHLTQRAASNPTRSK